MTVKITRIQAYSFRAPTPVPVETSFGIMKDRPAVFVRLEDEQGCFGWGEIFANWPAAGAEHRVRLLELDIAPLVLGKTYKTPCELFNDLTTLTYIRALQCGEFGPFRQVIAGLDIALWDLFARREDLSLRKFIRPEAGDEVPAYASGIAIHRADQTLPIARESGYTTFKVKVGFDLETDVALSEKLISQLGQKEKICADANQAWNLERATRFLQSIDGLNFLWLEEPMVVDTAIEQWEVLSCGFSTPLAGGENLTGVPGFQQYIDSGVLEVIQPDVAKWGGITGCLEVAQYAINSGKRYCPHFLGGGIGLAASAELLAAAGGDGLLEVDCNANQLRDGFFNDSQTISEGMWQCTDSCGLGITELPVAIQQFQTLQVECV